MVGRRSLSWLPAALSGSGAGRLGSPLPTSPLPRYGAPVVVVVYDDEKWGAIALSQQRAYGTEIEMSLPRRAWWKVMRAMGGHGVYVDDERDLGDALTRALESRVPAVVQVKVPSVEAPYVTTRRAGSRRGSAAS